MKTRTQAGIGAAAVFGLAAFAAVSRTSDNSYARKVLVANRPELAEGGLVDPHMVNAWGLALRPPGAGGHFWISNAGNLSTSTYIGDANGVALHQDGLTLVYLAGPVTSYEDGLANVTGQVYNAASDVPGQPVEFPVSGPASDWSTGKAVSSGITAGSAKFVFVTTDGTIHAWRATTKEAMNRAVLIKDYTDQGPDQIKDLPRRPAFTGVAMSTAPHQRNRLFVADFQNGTIRVFDDRWTDTTTTVPFARPANVPAEFSPYNIQAFNGRLYVTFAVLDRDRDEPGAALPGPGSGRVAVYDVDGHLVQSFADAEHLNAPWGMAIAPQNFGAMSGSLLVANFGDGTIAGFDPSTGAFKDYLRDAKQRPVVIDKVWGLAFGNGVSLGDADSLYFTAGPNFEQDGIFGRLRYASANTSAR